MKQPVLILLITSLSCALTIFDTNLVGVVLPSLVADLGADFARMTWVQSSFLISFASLLMASGALADRFGRRRLLLCGLSLFGSAALAAALAPGFGVLVAARVVQGMGAAFLLTPALAIIGHAFRQPGEAVRAWGFWGSLMGLTMVLAPILSSVIGELFGWRQAFLMLSAVTFALIPLVLRIIPQVQDQLQVRQSDAQLEPAPTSNARFDWPGAVVFCLTMLAITWTLISGSQNGWMHPATLLAGQSAIIGIGAFIRVEWGKAHPMLDLSLFRSRRFVGAVVGMLGYAATAQVMAALLPLYLQRGLGVSFLWVGVSLLPFSLAMFLTPVFARPLSGQWDASRLLALGLFVIGAGNLGLAHAAQTGGLVWSLLGMILLGTGGGLINGETQKAILGSLPVARQGMGAGISTTARFMGMLLGYTGLSAVLAMGIQTAMQEAICPQGAGTCTQLAGLSGWFQQVIQGETSLWIEQAGNRVLLTAHELYLQGFSSLFLCAGGVAWLAALICVSSPQPQPQADGIPLGDV